MRLEKDNHGLAVEDDGTFAFSGLYRELLNRFPDLNLSEAKNDSLNRFQDAHRAEIAAVFLSNDGSPLDQVEVSKRLFVFARKIEAILSQAEIDAPCYEMILFELFGLEYSSNSRLLDPSKVDLKAVQDLGIDKELEIVSEIDLAENYEKVLVRIREIFESSERIDIGRERNFVLPTGEIVGVEMKGGNPEAPSIFKTDLLGRAMMLFADVQAFEGTDIEQFNLIHNLANEVMRDIDRHTTLSNYIPPGLIEKTAFFEEMFESIRGVHGKPLKKLSHLRSHQGYIDRNPSAAKKNILEALKRVLMSIIVELDRLKRRLKKDSKVVTSLMRKESELVDSIYEEFKLFGPNFKMLRDVPLTETEVSSLIESMTEKKARLSQVKFAPYTYTARLIIKQIDLILEKLNLNLVDTNTGKTAVEQYEKEIVSIYELCKIDSFIKFLIEVSMFRSTGLSIDVNGEILEKAQALYAELEQNSISVKANPNLIIEGAKKVLDSIGGLLLEYEAKYKAARDAKQIISLTTLTAKYNAMMDKELEAYQVVLDQLKAN